MKPVLLFLSLLLAAASCHANERWTVYYGTELPAETFDNYDVVVLDGENSAPITALKAKGKTVLGYISFGEAESYRSYFKDIKAKKLLLKANPEWKDHMVIDVRKPAWKDYLVETLIPKILENGFDGVMFDTVDSPLHLGHKNAEEQKHLQEASIALLCEIRKVFPQARIMINRGFDILPAVAPCIDMLLAESTFTDLQLESKKEPRLIGSEEYGWYVEVMKRAQLANPSLKIYTLDYWPPEDHSGIRKIYAAQRSNGFIPYVSTIDLQQVYSEPPE